MQGLDEKKYGNPRTRRNRLTGIQLYRTRSGRLRRQVLHHLRRRKSGRGQCSHVNGLVSLKRAWRNRAPKLKVAIPNQLFKTPHRLPRFLLPRIAAVRRRHHRPRFYSSSYVSRLVSLRYQSSRVGRCLPWLQHLFARCQSGRFTTLGEPGGIHTCCVNPLAVDVHGGRKICKNPQVSSRDGVW